MKTLFSVDFSIEKTEIFFGAKFEWDETAKNVNGPF